MGVLALTWVALGAVGVGLAVAQAATARRPAAPPAVREEYLRRWSDLHGGYDAAGSALSLRWLTGVYALARPLAAAGVSPTAVTWWGLWTAAVADALAAPGRRWPLVAVVAVVVSGVLDNLDGAVAVLSGRATRFGYVLDSLADRVADTAYVLALWLLGAPGPLCVAGGGLAAAQEYTRARAGNAGMGQIGVVSVWERPTRVIVTAFALLGCGALPGHAGPVATAGAAAWSGLGAVGCAQVLTAVRTALR